MEIPTLKAEERRAAGSRAAMRLRRGGKLPGIVYGHQIDPQSVVLNRHEVALLLEHGKHLVNLEIGGQTQACLFKDAQYDHLGLQLIHLDLARVDLTERVKVRVTIDLRGTPKGVADGGGVLTAVLKELEVECQVTNIPETIRVDVGALELDKVMYVKDVKLEPGLTMLSDSEAVVAMVRKPLAVEEAPAEAAAKAAEGAAAEPEVISKGKVVAEGEEEAK